MTYNMQQHNPPLPQGDSTNDFHNIYTSPPFKFIIKGTPTYIHKDLISQISQPLDRMINGPMIEAQQGFVVLDVVEVDTFHRFVEWAYKGHYTPASFTIDPNLIPPPPPEPTWLEDLDRPRVSTFSDFTAGAMEAASVSRNLQYYTPSNATLPEIYASASMGWSKSLGTRTPHGYPSSHQAHARYSMKNAFHDFKYSSDAHTITSSQPSPCLNEICTEDYTTVFLSHVDLYVFADTYDIQVLNSLALDTVHDVLRVYKLYEARVGDVVALFRYVYANTVREEDEMRVMLRAYLGVELEMIMRDQGFRDLMVEDGGASLADFTRAVGERVRWP